MLDRLIGRISRYSKSLCLPAWILSFAAVALAGSIGSERKPGQLQTTREVQPCDARPHESRRTYIDRQLDLLRLETPENLVMILVTPVSGMSPDRRTEYGVALRTTTQGPKIVATRAQENIWYTNRSEGHWTPEPVPVALDQWEAPINEASLMLLWEAFRHQAEGMSFRGSRPPRPAFAWEYRFYVVLPALGIPCGEIDVFDDGREDYISTRLAERMVDYAKSSDGSGRERIREELMRLADEMKESRSVEAP